MYVGLNTLHYPYVVCTYKIQMISINSTHRINTHVCLYIVQILNIEVQQNCNYL